MAAKSRARSRSTDKSPVKKSPARDNRKFAGRNSHAKMIADLAFYIATLSESYKSRRELFLPVKCFAIMSFLSFGCAMYGYENLGVRLFAGMIAFVSILVFCGASLLEPKVLVKAAMQAKDYTYDGNRKSKSMSKVYVAHTGYHTEDGSPIYGVYSGSFIPAG